MDEEYARKKELMDWIVAGMAGRHYPKPAPQDKTYVNLDHEQDDRPLLVKAAIGETAPKKTLLGDLKRRLFDDPDFDQHTYEDLHISYQDNINDAYNNGWITLQQWKEFYPKARAKDESFNKLGPLAPSARFFKSQIDNKFGIGELSKKNLERKNK